MRGRDNRDTRGQFETVPMRGQGDTTGPPLGGVPVSHLSPAASTAERIFALSRRIGRLSPSWRDPERYFEERDEIERALQRIAREVRLG